MSYGSDFNVDTILSIVDERDKWRERVIYLSNQLNKILEEKEHVQKEIARLKYILSTANMQELNVPKVFNANSVR